MGNVSKKIAIIVCYSGKLPWYFHYFTHSCAYNPGVDFLIITDDDSYKRLLPKNVRLVYKTLSDISKIAARKLGFPVSLDRGYKLCDFKPVYGLLFSEMLSGYTFWGHGDIDVIYGDIRAFLTDDLLDSYDLISVRPDWITGCFLLFRNTPFMNSLFVESKDYRMVLTNDKYLNFDEAGFGQDAFSEGKTYEEVETGIESMMHVVKKMEKAGRLRAYFDLHIIEGTPGKLKWQQGKLTYKGMYEALLYHMIFFKKNYSRNSRDRELPDTFTISPTRIYHRHKRKSI